jgi:hypothetical protein
MPNDLRPPLDATAPGGSTAATEGDNPGGTHTMPQKYELGRAEPGVVPEHIPWGYAQDRVTAMVVDPDYLYAYWEVTADAIEQARTKLGAGGKDAWLNVRVYDVTGRLFDGTNAHSYFDHRIERHDRQWFFYIGKPTSTSCVEVGVKSFDGYFVRIARSGRLEFPRREPAGFTEPEWLTVYAATGPVGEPVKGRLAGAQEGASAGTPAGAGAPPPQGTGEQAGGEAYIHSHQEIVHRIIAQMLEQRWDWERFFTYEWADGLQRLEWEGPVVRSSWEAGPFTHPVDVPGYIEQRFEGRSVVFSEHGTTHIIYGPWQVLIRGLGAKGERRVLARWEMYTSWVASAGYTARTETYKAATPGASEMLLGASERRWLGGSEMLMRGGSEVYQIGASELRFAGASETRFRGASEWRLRGASEQRLVGASEYRARGASEQLYGGASELLRGGASEQLHGGASELVRGGASEGRFPGPSDVRPAEGGEQRIAGADERAPSTPPEGRLGYPEVKPSGDKAAGEKHG